jgi:iron complex transport system permease protein
LRNRGVKWTTHLILLILIALAVSVLALCVGTLRFSPVRLLRLIMEGRNEATYTILMDIRLPRIVLGFVVGGALSVAGVMLQGLFRNSLVEPYTLGISGGAALGVSLNTLLGLGPVIGFYGLPILGFLGSLSVIIFLYAVSTRRGTLNMHGVLLTGVMVNFISSSIVMLIMAISRAEDLQAIVFWLIGSLSETDWYLVGTVSAVTLVGLLISYLFCFDLNALSLGEEEAQHLGISVERTKRVLLILASALTGVSVSVSGAIGFVGLVVPHFMRMIVGVDHRILLISSFLGGGSFLVFCDSIARIVALPVELPVGVVTGILGGILFIYSLTKREVSFGER